MPLTLRHVLYTAALAGLLNVAASASAAPVASPRAVVLGFDGASADRVEKLMADGKLPNLAALAKRGGYSKLATSNPAQSPVSWATLTTGWNPGKTGIYDFLRRYPNADKTGITIDFAHAELRHLIPIPVAGRAGLVLAAGAAGAAAGIGLVLAIYAGKRRARRPRGLMQGVMTGSAAVLAAAAYVVLQWVPMTVPKAHNLRSGDPFWVTLDRAGVRCVALEAPLSFPADVMKDGCCLSGLGAPDAQGSWGVFSTWTDDPSGKAETETGGVAYFVQPGAKRFDLVLVGPKCANRDSEAARDARNAAEIEKEKRLAAFDWSPVRRRTSETAEAMLRLADHVTTRLDATVETGKAVHLTTAQGVKVSLVPGVWSALVPVVFKVTPVVSVRALTRFLLASAGSAPTATGEPWRPLSIFVAPVQFDPLAVPPNVGLSSPTGFIEELAKANGEFETLGWPEMTSAVKDDVLADRAFIDHVDLLRKNREKRLLERLGRSDWDLMFALFSEPDRVQHALYRHVDPKSPRHDPAVAPAFAGEIDRSYREMDRLVGEVVAAVGPDTQVFVCSDHGFAPFRRGVNLNNLLCSKGFQIRSGLAGPQGVGSLRDRGEFFPDVHWEDTKAYAMGLGNLYLNLAGREPLGAVKPADAEKVLAEIEAALLELRDTDGTKVVRRVYRGKDLYHGARAKEAPDLVVGFEWGYRISWQASLGAVDDDIIVDNTFRWSGDHCSVDPELVPGVLFSSLALDATATPSVEDVAPSVLSVFGVTPNDPDGRNVLAR